MKNIALIDFSLQGHHLSFLQTFSTILLKNGYRVFAIVPEAERLAPYVAAHASEWQANFIPVDYPQPDASSLPTSGFKETIGQLKKWKREAALVKAIENKHKVRIDFVFYAWLDYQFARYIHPFVLNSLFPYKWSGLYFHPYHLRLNPENLQKKAIWRDFDSIFLSSNCTGVAVHDSGIMDGFAQRIGKQVIHFPETADDTTPDLEYELYRTIKQKAGNRIVIGMIGCESHKGTLTLVKTAKMADPSRYFFVYLGILPEHTYNTEDWQEVQAYINARPENAFFRFQPIPEGACYNAVFTAFDIPFLVYDNFISSSNRLTKAAIFEKLVLASDNYCVGDDVRKYNLGVTVKPKDPHAALAALNTLSGQISKKEFPVEEWKAYRELNSVNLLEKRFKQLLTNI